jgi:hypothetical protein
MSAAQKLTPYLRGATAEGLLPLARGDRPDIAGWLAVERRVGGCRT